MLRNFHHIFNIINISNKYLFSYIKLKKSLLNSLSVKVDKFTLIYI
jgi:hypothetical protein